MGKEKKRGIGGRKRGMKERGEKWEKAAGMVEKKKNKKCITSSYPFRLAIAHCFPERFGSLCPSFPSGLHPQHFSTAVFFPVCLLAFLSL